MDRPTQRDYKRTGKMEQKMTNQSNAQVRQEFPGNEKNTINFGMNLAKIEKSTTLTGK